MYAQLHGSREIPSSHSQSSPQTPTIRIQTPSTSHKIENDIASRIRALLLSRNIRHPPRTPAPSEDSPRSYYPESEYAIRSLDIQDRLSSILNWRPSSVVQSGEGPQRLPALNVHSLTPPMDGEGEAASSHPSLDLNVDESITAHDRTVYETRLNVSSGLDEEYQTSPTKNDSREAFSGALAQESSDRKYEPVQRHIRPSFQHVPGSYRSELPKQIPENPTPEEVEWAHDHPYESLVNNSTAVKPSSIEKTPEQTEWEHDHTSNLSTRNMDERQASQPELTAEEIEWEQDHSAGIATRDTVEQQLSLPGPSAEQIEWQHDHAAPRSLTKRQISNPSLAAEEIEWEHDHASKESVRAPPKKRASFHSDSSSTSLHGYTKPVSMLSGASRSSAFRHALLKPSNTSNQPVDLGLPAQPVLTTFGTQANEDVFRHGSIAETSVAALDDIYQRKSSPRIDDNSFFSEKFPKDSVGYQRNNVLPTEDYDPRLPTRRRSMKPALSQKLLEPQQDAKITVPVAVDGKPAVVENPVLHLVREDDDDDDDSLPSRLSPAQAAYWGFSPHVKLAVESAVQQAIEKVVREVKLPPGVRQDAISHVYRRLIAESLADATHEADEFLRRKSIWEAEQTTSGITSSIAVHQSQPQETVKPGSIPKFLPENLVLSPPVLFREDSDPTGHHPVPIARAVEAASIATVSMGNEISCETPDEKPLKNAKLPFFLGKTTSGYAAVPSRKSSMKQLKSNTITKAQPVEQLSRSLPKDVRHSNSVASLQTQTPPPEETIPSTHVVSQSSRPKVQRGATFGTIKAVPHGQMDRKKTIAWLRELLSESDPYSPRLTELPPKTYQSQTESRINRSQSSPQQPVDNLYLGATARAPLAAKPSSRAHVPRASEIFTKTIEDLENLLNEALFIAREAAEPEGIGTLPALLLDAATALENSRANLDENAAKRGSTRIINRPEYRPGYSDDSYSRGSVHESLLSISSNSDINFDDDNSHAGLGSTTNNQSKTDATFAPKMGSRGWLPGVATVARSSNKIDTGTEPRADFKAHQTLLKNATPRAVSDPEPDLTAPTGKITEDPAAKYRMEEPLSKEGTAFLPYTEEGYDYDPYTNRRHHINHRTATLPSPKHLSSSRGYNATLPILREPYQTNERPGMIHRKSEYTLPNKREVRDFIRIFHQPPIHSRDSSLALRKLPEYSNPPRDHAQTTGIDFDPTPREPDMITLHSIQTLDGLNSGDSDMMDFSTPPGVRQHAGSRHRVHHYDKHGSEHEMQDMGSGDNKLPRRHISGRRLLDKSHQYLSLRGRAHVSIDNQKGFSLSRSHKRAPIARDWSPIRKRFVAAVACISTTLIGILIGIYAGEVPSIQYYIADFHHFAVLGNVFFYIGLAIPTFFFWPLPLLHGRKPYILASMTIAMPLLFPQAVAIQMQRSPYTDLYRVGLILPRTFMGFALGFAQINFMATLLDLFGASLMSSNPHQEVVDNYDVRRHGGGIGLWLGIWTWAYVGSVGLGFLIGAWIIDTLSPDWGFYVSIVIIACVLLLNVVTPEVRRSAFRRSVAEIRTPTDVTRRLARGEVMMHRVQSGPIWWGQELQHGLYLSLDMLRQPGFLIMALYTSWIYGQVVLVIVLLGSLMSKYYRFTSPSVGVTTLAIPLGALLAIPFQKASLFSRARHHPQRTDSMTFEKRVTWSSHLARRAIFTLVLPFAGLGYTLSSGGPPVPWILPILFAGLISFLSSLAIAECYGLIMETFDTSDLQPGMTGRPRGRSGERTKHKRTNYSSFPRIASAFALCQGFGFLIASGATGVGGVAERSLGAKAATGVMAAILLVLTVLLLIVLVRWKEVQIIPTSKTGDMARWEQQRKASVSDWQARKASWNSNKAIGERPQPPVIEEEPWRPIIIGNPSGKTRRMSILELGHLTRWSEIRKKNRLIDQGGYEERHPNLATMGSVRKKLREQNLGSLRGRRSRKKDGREQLTSEATEDLELPELRSGRSVPGEAIETRRQPY